MRKQWLRCALPILVGVTLAACAKAPPPSVAPESTIASATAAPAAPARRSPEEFRVSPALTVRTVKSARAYTGRGTFYLQVAELPAGTEVEYLESREGWVYVRTPDGDTGWLAPADVAISDGRNQAVTYTMAQGRWRMEAEAGWKVEISRAGTGVLRVQLSGAAAQAKAEVLSDGSLLLPVTLPPGMQTAFDIGDSGLGRLSLSERGALLELTNRPVHRFVPVEGAVALEIRPGLEKVERVSNGWGLTIRGDLRPVLRQEGSELVMDLPGALPAETFAGAPDGVTWAEVGPEAAPGGAAPQPQQAGSLTATIPTRMTLGGIRLRLPAPAAPYALYRTGAGRLELRVLPAGLAGKMILLDPGHGGEETGAVGVAGNLEKDVNLAVSLRLRPLLEQAGARVLMTRTEDVRVLPEEAAGKLKTYSERTQADLALRSARANAAGADLVISVHANGGPEGDGGTETFWAISNLNAAKSQYLAGLVQAELIDALGLHDRGVKQRPFNVIRMSNAPAVLVELGFMTSGSEEWLLTSQQGQEAAARAIFRGVAAYFQAEPDPDGVP